MDMFKKPYEISLWEDELVFIGEGEDRFSYYKEVKVATIGSDSMDSPARCLSPKLSRKVNGENTLTFTMYYRYWDDDAQDFVYNPFNRLMVNERKVKLRLGEPGPDAQWFDFIVKNVQENSESKVFTYTCKDQFVNELSKSGFEIELDNELENNMGTIEVLAGRILEGSDWKVLPNDTDLKQYKEEPLYRVTLGANITAINALTGAERLIEKGKDIYVFYSDIHDKQKTQWWFLYTDGQFKTNDDLLIDREHPNYFIDVGTYEEYPSFVGIRESDGTYLIELSMKYRGEKLVRQVQTKYDSTIDKYVGVYKKDGELYYGYTQTEYSTSGAIVNYVANPSSFTSTSGWDTDANQLDYEIYTEKNSNTALYESYLKIDFANKQGALVRNSGIGGNRTVIGQFAEGEQYVLRIKYKNQNGYMSTAPIAKICEYDYIDHYYNLSEPFFDFSQTENPNYINEIDKDGKFYRTDDNYIYMLATCSRSISKAELTNWDFKIGLFFDFDTTDTIYIEDLQVFKYEIYVDEDGVERLCIPGGKLLSEIKTKYIYYKPDKTMKSIEDLKPVYSEYENNTDFEQQYGVEGAEGNEFTKVRSISAKESNRFNLIQDLCETFECWPKFTIERNPETGEIYYDENYRQKKFVSFHEYVGKENFIGFRYGVNSKSIQRTIDSAAIVSKMIVKDNANEFAPNGFCSIARASENPTGENFLLSFDHYVRQGLLDFDVVTNDLYVNANGYLGYYTQLKELNTQRDPMIEKQSGLLIDIANYESAYTTYKTSYDSAVEQQLIVEKSYCKLAGKEISHDEFFELTETDANTDELKKYWHQWCQYQNVIVQHGELYPKAEVNLKNAQNEFDNYSAKLKEIIDTKRELALQFYKKYSRFIQEGSWIKEDYTDPNLYYLDAESTLHTSAQPKVTYNISVIDVAPLASQEGYEDFAHYSFDIGDRTYIEDVEFFGWSLANRSAPYREEVVVSEVTMELDSPEKNQIKVQNYKTQFEDLFQRITASTQQAEYHTGEYERAASVVETNGTISADTLANSFANNSFKLSNARDQSVVWDSSGITTTSLNNPSEMVRIISGGVFLSTDGGQSWKTGITGSGINTSYLTAGQINTNEIYIMNGNNAAFRWDEKGLSAYWANKNYDGQTTSYNTNKFVRFDHNGLYGVIGEDDWVPASLDDIQENAPFALTWKGFSLKNNDGSVRISTENDIQVLDNSTERLKIGRLGYQYVAFSGNSFAEGVKYYIPTENGYEETQDKEPQEKTTYYTYELVYGIKISNDEGRAVMETDDKGELWLKGRLRVGDETTSTVEIGYLDQETIEGQDFHKVISAGQDSNIFAVYENGYIKTTAGKIGNISITERGLIVGRDESPFLSLNDEGLVIRQSGIKLEDSNNNTVFNLTEDGLEMTAKIHAIDASFDNGEIGGFTISGNNLSSANGGIVLSGANDEIIANSIKLGTGAEITEHIKLGSAYIKNPDILVTENNDTHRSGVFIESGDIKIFDDGTAKFGSISIDGSNSKIHGNNFYITPNEAMFSNVTVSGKIQTAIFEQGTIQAAGGMVLIRPSTRIVINDFGECLLENSMGFNDGDLCEVDGKACKILINGGICSFKTLSDNPFKPDNGSIIIGYGQVDNNIGIAINTTNNSAGFLERALTVFETVPNKNDDMLTKIPRIILGDLGKNNEIDKYGNLSGYGLYAENVYLHGALVTGFEETYYSGFNGKRRTDSTEPYTLLWAGAEADGVSGEYDIEKAPFRVDSEGNLYASKGTFKGSIISNATIEAAQIITPILRGNGNNPALEIHDTENGIQFKNNDEISLQIDASGLAHSGKSFVEFSKDGAIFKTNGMELKNNQISWSTGDQIIHGLSYENNIFEFGGLNESIASTVVIKLLAREVQFGQNFKYEPKENGCDLYVY